MATPPSATRSCSPSSCAGGTTSVLADTGAVYALLDRRDAWHERVLGAWERHADQIQVPATVVVETCQLLSYRIGAHAEEGFLRAVVRGEFVTSELESEDYARAAELVGAYADLPLGFVDASVVAIAERLRSDTVLTIDRRHFGIVRPRHVERLRLVL